MEMSWIAGTALAVLMAIGVCRLLAVLACLGVDLKHFGLNPPDRSTTVPAMDWGSA
jgi:hypothetical protein